MDFVQKTLRKNRKIQTIGEQRNMKCCFDKGNYCGILKAKLCWECKFRKTKEEFDKADEDAEKSLILRHLGRSRIVKDGVEIMTANPMLYI